MSSPKDTITMPLDKCQHSAKHLYHDYANVIKKEDLEEEVKLSSEPKSCNKISKKIRKGPRGGVTTPFPLKLHKLLEDGKYPDIISWQPHGRCFILRKPQEFLTKVMTKYFKQTKLTSFQRQLNLYDFKRLSTGPDKGAYYHELFLRGRTDLCSYIFRMRVKGTKTKSACSPETEPNFYSMPPVKEENKCKTAEIVEAVSEDDTVSSRSVQADQTHSDNTFSNGSNTGSVFSDPCDSSECPPLLPYQTHSPKITPITSYVPPSIITQDFIPQSFHSRIHFVSPPPSEPQTVTFEGKGFYYLESFDHWDACTLPVADEKTKYSSDLVGLSVDPLSGQVCGFEV